MREAAPSAWVLFASDGGNIMPRCDMGVNWVLENGFTAAHFHERQRTSTSGPAGPRHRAVRRACTSGNLALSPWMSVAVGTASELDVGNGLGGHSVLLLVMW